MLVDVSKTERLEHPHEAGQWVEIRPLLATELDEARDKRIKALIDTWGDMLKDTPRDVSRKEADNITTRVQQYDMEILLNAAVVAWSYDAPVSPENIKRLDGVTRDWLIEEVVKRNTRPLAR